MSVRQRSWILALPALLIVSLCLPRSAGALGLGLSFDVKDSKTNFDEGSADSTAKGLSFVLDTNVAADRVFNYRLALGYEQEKWKGGGKVDRYTLTNAFGFGVVRTPAFRFWIGPRVVLAYGYHAKFDNDYRDFEIGVGPVLGANFNLGPVVTLGLELGYAVSAYAQWPDGHNESGTKSGPQAAVLLLFRLNEQ